MATTLQQLLSPKTITDLTNIILGYLQANGFPTTDWIDGGVEKTRMAAWVTALADTVQNYVPQVTAGGFVDYASGPWLQLLAAQRFGVPFNDASRTFGKIVLTNSSSRTYTIGAGQAIVQFTATGNRYLNAASFTISGSSSTTVDFVSEFPNNSPAGLNYTDPNNSAITMVTSYPGVGAANPGIENLDLIPITSSGKSTGTISLSGALPDSAVLVLIRFDASGNAGAANWSYSINGGEFVSEGNLAVDDLSSPANVTVTLNDGIVTPSFVAGDNFQFAIPGSWITQQGTDVESDPALAQRCRNRWPTLASAPTMGLYDYLARLATNQVTQTVVVNDPAVNNKVDIFVAGQQGALPISVVRAIQTFIDAWAPTTDYPVVLSPASVDVTIAGTIYYDKSFTQSDMLAAIEAAQDRYLGSLPVNATIDLSELVVVTHSVTGVKYVDLSQPFTINGREANYTVVDNNTMPAVVGNRFFNLSLIAI